ncbi:MAG: hypothetical protein ACJAYU_002012 [Bradymonadia bacterium]
MDVDTAGDLVADEVSLVAFLRLLAADGEDHGWENMHTSAFLSALSATLVARYDDTEPFRMEASPEWWVLLAEAVAEAIANAGSSGPAQ